MQKTFRNLKESFCPKILRNITFKIRVGLHFWKIDPALSLLYTKTGVNCAAALSSFWYLCVWKCHEWMQFV